MAYIQAVPAEHLQWASYAVTLLAGVLSDGVLAVLLRRGFGRRGFGRRGFGGRGLGPFRILRFGRILFVLLFTTVLGPILLVVLLVIAGYWFYASRR